MAEYPAMPLMTDAYLADTMHLTNEEHGAYLRLLIIAWRTPTCSLPDDDKRLATMLGVTVKRWKDKLRPVIEPFWRVENGVWTQKKQLEVRKKVEKNVQQKRDAYAQTKRAKLLKSLEANQSADPSGDQSPEEPTKTKTKESESRLGLERRSLSPGGHDPPGGKPDPEKFSMSKNWAMSRPCQVRLVEKFMSDLGEDPFWRQVERFMDEHIRRGTVETQAGFERQLDGWMARADANRPKAAAG